MNTTPAPAGSTGAVLPEIADHVLLRRIGQGAYGEVWLGRNMTGAFRAVKVIHRRTFSDEHPFRREFEGVCRFETIPRSHPGLVTILHVGQNAHAGYFFYVMELADDVRTGQIIDVNSYVPKTLREELANQRRLPLHKQLEIALSLASALEYLHARNLIHRDIKPANIIFVNGLAKLADVGLMVEAGEERSGLGTRFFTPPEGPGAPTGDIFSLGKVFYEMFMGMPAKSFPELPGAAEEFTAIPALLKLNNLVLKACHADPRQRFQTAGELRNALLTVTEMVHEKQSATKTSRPSGDANAGEALRSSAEGAATADGEPKARWTRRAALLVLVPAIPGAVILFRNCRKPVSAVPAHAPLIVLMDTTAPRGVYDPDNIDKGRSNADELYTRLAGLDGIVLQQKMTREGIGLDWARDHFVAAQHPDIVIIHRSSFFHPLAAFLKLEYPPFTDDADGEKLKKWQAIYDAQDDRLRSFIRTVGAVEPQTQFLIYSTGTDKRWLDDGFRANWTKTLESELPTFKGRINTMVIPNQPNGAKGTFRDPATMKEIRSRVSEMIKKLERLKAEKAK